MPYVPQSDPTGVLTEAFMATLLDNMDFLKSEVDALRALGLRQAVQSSGLGSPVTVTSISQTDVTGLSASITTTGGRLRIMMVPTATDAEQASLRAYVASSTPGRASGIIRAVVGATALTAMEFGQNDADPEIAIPPTAYVWDYTPSSGTYTVKIQARTVTNIQLVFGTGIRLRIEEWAA